ncbi:cell wall adhesin EAP1-like isoform X2 [Oreochromis niloticus]|nr:cell wall adhesin EAP1-like isoform X2 [Oreochromis niloticus]XP_019212917.1 cell wall adhesin EAP1-like isoform X2 [Oreochromis niloticus]
MIMMMISFMFKPPSLLHDCLRLDPPLFFHTAHSTRRDSTVQPDMVPAAFTPPTELWELITDSASKLINLWLEHEGEAFLYTVETRLQQLISGYPWLLDSLHPPVRNFVLHKLHLHPSATTTCPLASTEDVPSKPPDEELPDPSEQTPKRKRHLRRPHRWHGTPQPDVGTCNPPAVVSERDTVSALSDTRTIYSGAIFCVSTEDNSGFSVSSMAIASKTVSPEPTLCDNDCVHSIVPSSLPPQPNVKSETWPAVQSAVQSAAQLPAVQSAATLPAVQSATPPTVTPPLPSSSLPVAQLPLVQQPAHSFIQSPSSPSHCKQGTPSLWGGPGGSYFLEDDQLLRTSLSFHEGCQSPANSGPLEVKPPAPAISPENFTEQSQPSSPAESSSEFTHPPQSSAECVGEHFQPSKDCIVLNKPPSLLHGCLRLDPPLFFHTAHSTRCDRQETYSFCPLLEHYKPMLRLK